MKIKKIEKTISDIQLELAAVETKRSILMTALKNSRLPYFTLKYNVAVGDVVAVFPNSFYKEKGKPAIIEAIDHRYINTLDQRPWVKVRMKKKNGEFSKRTVHAFGNWRSANET